VSLTEQVALVTDGGGPLGRAVALALAARGVRIVVTGPVEKPVGETVGEIVYGGGKARHVVADPRDRAGVGSAVARAHEVFGRLDVLFIADADPTAVECILTVASASAEAAPRVVEPTATERARDPEEFAQELVLRLST